MDKVTPADLMTFFWVGAALIAFALAIWALIDKIKKARQPAQELKHWQMETDQKLDKDKKRIDSLEEGNVVLIKAISAMLSHEITGNSIDKLKEARDQLTTYLIER